MSNFNTKAFERDFNGKRFQKAFGILHKFVQSDADSALEFVRNFANANRSVQYFISTYFQQGRHSEYNLELLKHFALSFEDDFKKATKLECAYTVSTPATTPL